MRLPRPRFTLRWLMVAMVGLALVIAGIRWVLWSYERGQLDRRWYEHKSRAYTIWSSIGGIQSTTLPSGAVAYRPGTPPASYHNAEWDAFLKGLSPQVQAQYAAIERRYNYHLKMWAKWELAAPWSKVEPDLPAPPVPGLDGQYPF